MRVTQELHVEPTIALLIQRPALRWSDAASTGAVDLAQIATELLQVRSTALYRL
jgi:hypothetical protein